MRWLRLIFSMIAARFGSKLFLQDSSVISFRVWLTDVDATIMNHASMLTVFEAGRLDYTIRTGFFKLARKKKWVFPLVAQSVQYFRPLKVFQKAQLSTRVFHATDNYIFTEQIITYNGKEIALCISKIKVKSGKQDVATSAIAAELHAGEIPTEAGERAALFDKEKEMLKK